MPMHDPRFPAFEVDAWQGDAHSGIHEKVSRYAQQTHLPDNTHL